MPNIKPPRRPDLSAAEVELFSQSAMPGGFTGPTGENDAAPAPAATGNAVFPTTVSPKYSGEFAGKARMQTCLDQYRANKGNGANGGLKWIEKGGRYYSQCKRLKGAA